MHKHCKYVHNRYTFQNIVVATLIKNLVVFGLFYDTHSHKNNFYSSIFFNCLIGLLKEKRILEMNSKQGRQEICYIQSTYQQKKCVFLRNKKAKEYQRQTVLFHNKYWGKLFFVRYLFRASYKSLFFLHFIFFSV